MSIKWKQFANKQGCVLSRDIVTRKAIGHYLDLVFAEDEPIMKYYKYVDFTHYLGTNENNHKVYEEMCDRVRKEILSYGKDDFFSFTKRLSKKWLKFCDELLIEMNKESTNREDLHSMFLRFVEQYGLKISLVVLNFYYIESLTREINERLKNYTNDVEKSFLALGTSFDENEVQEMKIEITQLVIEIISKKQEHLFSGDWEQFNEKAIPELKEKIKQISQKYIWSKIMYLVGGPLTEEDVYESIKVNLKKNPEEQLSRLEEDKNIANENYKQELVKLNLDSQLLNLIEMLRESSSIRTKEVEEMMYGEYKGYLLIEKIGKFLGLNYQEITCLTVNEIIKELMKTNIHKKIKQRKEGFAYVKEDKNIWLVDHPAEIEKIREVIEERKEIEGMIAYKGKVTGVARIINRSDELHRFKEGEILVTPMTTPDYVMAMEKAAAIVTNDGGITCHAAILSREFRVPCIVGTGHATKLIQDGDLIEVDAEEGIVRRLGDDENGK